MSPDELLKLFELLYENIDESENGYIYILLELEMIDKVKEILSSTEPNELLNFKAYLELKNLNKHYNIELFL